MGSTSIEWATKVWNPVTGCHKVSEGCRNCYAATIAHRLWPTQYGNGRKFTDVRTHADRIDEPRRWRKPQRVFVNSMSDLFHKDVPDGFIAWVWWRMAHCPRHTFLILTKRPERMFDWCRRWADRSGDDAADQGRDLPPMPRGPAEIRATYTSGRAHLFADMLEQWGEPPAGAAFPLYDWAEGMRFWPGDSLPNVWLGVSAENDEQWQQRVPWLLSCPAAVHFVSAEPLLGPINARRAPLGEETAKRFGGIVPHEWFDPLHPNRVSRHGRVDWIIAGGESGPGARPCDVAWIRSLVEQCRAAGVAPFVKQVGSGTSLHTEIGRGRHVRDGDAQFIVRDRKGGAMEEWPADLRVRELPR